MGISQFPAPSTGGGVTNDFILDKNDTTNNVFSPGRSFEGGGYSVVVTGSTAYDLYLLDSTGSAVGYTNGTSVVASAAFETIVGLGLGTADTVAFTYNGPSTDASAAGNQTGAGPYLTSITPSDLPQIDDTAIVAGGNFASDVQVSFTSGTVELAAKNVVVGSSTALVVTRPDGLIEDLAPYDLKAVNPGIQSPVGSNANILAGTVTAGTDPSFVTTSPILGAFSSTAFSSAILTSDSEGTVVSWEVTAGTLPSGITLGSADGVLAGTPSADGEYTFTVQITDDGGNTNSQQFLMPVGVYITGGSAVTSGGTAYYTFLETDVISVQNVGAGTATLEYIIVAGGGGGNSSTPEQHGGGGGGGGGLLWGTASVTSDTIGTVSIGAGGSPGANGTDSYISFIGTATGGGRGGNPVHGAGGSGGSGGGAGSSAGTGGSAISGQGFPGQNSGYDGENFGGGGGGAGQTSAVSKQGGNGLQFGAWATAVSVVFDNGYFAGGGGGGRAFNSPGSRGLGGAGDGSSSSGTPGSGLTNSGGGGGGAGRGFGANPTHASGGSGIVLVRKI